MKEGGKEEEKRENLKSLSDTDLTSEANTYLQINFWGGGKLNFLIKTDSKIRAYGCFHSK